jgi:histidinol-phosphate aminotransferase
MTNKIYEEILNQFNGIVVLDEAYEDFSKEESWISEIDNFPQLVVMQTFSKAWGMAGLRVGMAFAQQEILELMNKVKPPYNISILNQKEVFISLQKQEKFRKEMSDLPEMEFKFDHQGTTVIFVS